MYLAADYIHPTPYRDHLRLRRRAYKTLRKAVDRRVR